MLNYECIENLKISIAITGAELFLEMFSKKWWEGEKNNNHHIQMVMMTISVREQHSWHPERDI